ncbi:heavy metal-associated isoprenylated plant protein 35-like [Nicotiana tabacum]|uniref:Heavy metal-associated isoprenylated plant protein 3-like n=2 Tax=Nicotiana TaxID=4085 RepID=A0A1S3ZD58_TOBAC|nr:PREDICTED: circumsporozoite protein [Nicotiana sylvestris]XP_016462264.1 PREDICTED: heavy metal-associated isoprenylated plant protein 3-like [Nicotiana tabacum]
MAAQDVSEDPPEQLMNYKTWVLKVSIHCEGCKRKVKKILQQVPGVYAIDIDLKQQRATVTGNVEAESLLRRLQKSGKHAELLPQQSDHKEKKPLKNKNKEKPIDQQSKEATTSQPDTSINKEVKPKVKVVVPKEASGKIQAASGEVPTKSEKPSSGSVKPEDEAGTGSGDGQAGAQGSEAGGEKGNSDEAVKESKSKGKKPETASVGEHIPVAAEKKGADSDNASVSGEKSGGGPGVEASGSTGKKKKKKGQNSNTTEGTQSSVAPAGAEFEHHDMGPQAFVPTNGSPPRHPGYHYYPQQGPQYYAPPPAYVVSYNTAQPTSTYTASYYAPAPPTSYAYTYSGPVTEPPPSDLDSYPRQPLDSFEMFSDENPNGCSVM